MCLKQRILIRTQKRETESLIFFFVYFCGGGGGFVCLLEDEERVEIEWEFIGDEETEE